MPSNDTATEPCLGEAGGHARFDKRGDILIPIRDHTELGFLKNFPDLELRAVGAIEGRPCIGWQLAPHIDPSEPHLLSLSVGFWVLHPSMQRHFASMGIAPDESGALHPKPESFDLLTGEQQQRLRDAYDRTLVRIVKRVGRPTVDVPALIMQMRAIFFELWPQGAREDRAPSRAMVLGELRRRHGIAMNAETLKKRLQRAQPRTDWPSLRKTWIQERRSEIGRKK